MIAYTAENITIRPGGVCLAWLSALLAVCFGACDAHQPLPDDGFVDVPGGRVAFRVLGSGTGVPVLMIHGGPGATSCNAASTMVGVASSRPVVIYDQLGSGNSDRMLDLERDATLPRFVEEVAAIRQQLGLEEVHLMGHSWGAAVALEYLLTKAPTGVLSATFVGPLFSTPRWLEDANALVESLPLDAREAIKATKISGNYDSEEFRTANKVFVENFLSRTPRDQWQLPACQATPVRFNVKLYKYMWGPSEFVSTGTLREYDRTEELSKVNLPTSFLVGEYDEARPETVREFQARVPGSIVKVITGAAHMSDIDQTEAFNEIVAEFLGSVEKSQ